MAQRDEHVRNISVDLLFQLKEKFPQVNSTGHSCPCLGLVGAEYLLFVFYLRLQSGFRVD